MTECSQYVDEKSRSMIHGKWAADNCLNTNRMGGSKLNTDNSSVENVRWEYDLAGLYLRGDLE